jgi:hypothetical protein
MKKIDLTPVIASRVSLLAKYSLPGDKFLLTGGKRPRESACRLLANTLQTFCKQTVSKPLVLLGFFWTVSDNLKTGRTPPGLGFKSRITSPWVTKLRLVRRSGDGAEAPSAGPSTSSRAVMESPQLLKVLAASVMVAPLIVPLTVFPQESTAV